MDYESARKDLNRLFALAEEDSKAGEAPAVPQTAMKAASVVFASSLRAPRQALLSFALMRQQGRDVSISGKSSGERGLDEKVVAPFLMEARIPFVRSAFLSGFFKAVNSADIKAPGEKNVKEASALQSYRNELEQATDTACIELLVRHLLWHFIKLREKLEHAASLHAGTAIRRIRKAKGLTLADVASKAGTDTGNLSRIENGKQGFSQQLIRGIAEAMGVNVLDIFKEADPDEPSITNPETGPFKLTSLEKSLIENLRLLLDADKTRISDEIANLASVARAYHKKFAGQDDQSRITDERARTLLKDPRIRQMLREIEQNK